LSPHVRNQSTLLASCHRLYLANVLGEASHVTLRTECCMYNAAEMTGTLDLGEITKVQTNLHFL
jgi:hypothetical protein